MKYLVTDPCYIVDDDMWTKLCDKADEETNHDTGNKWSNAFNKLVEDYLKSLYDVAYVASTGFGDWTNEIDGKRFVADAGMVTVVPADKIPQKTYAEYNNNLGAIIEVADNSRVILDTSNPEWTIVKVGNLQSLPYDDGEEEEEW